MRAAGYLRRSSDKKEGLSIAAQRRAVHDFCDARGHELVELYVDDGIGGGEWGKRTAFQRLLQDAQADRFDVLVVHDQSRLTRDHVDVEKGMALLTAEGVTVTTPTGALDWSTSQGRTVVRMTAVIDQGYREQVGEWIKHRKREMAKQGYQQGSPPFGYQQGEDGVFRPVPEEREVVRGLFASYLGGEAPADLAASLNGAGVHTRRGRTWTRFSIHAILTNPTYAGLVHHNYRTTGTIIGRGKHDALVDETDFWRVQEAAASRQRGSTRRSFGRRVYPLSNIARCQAGDHPMIGAGRRYMRCRMNQEHRKGACPQATVHADVFEAQIGAYVSGMVLPEEAVEAVLAAAREMSAPLAIDRRLLQTDLQKLLQSYRADLINWETFQREAAPVKQQLDAIDAPPLALEIEQAIALVRDQGAQWDAMDAAERRQYVETTFDRIVVSDRQVVEIQPKSDWAPLFQIDREARFDGILSLVGPAGFEPTTERL